MELKVSSESVEATQSLAWHLGVNLRGGEIINLLGDVGAGKTTFTTGLVAGAGSNDAVASPTFTICNVYGGRLKIYHCDFYRLQNDKLIQNELADMLDGTSVVVMEWAQNIPALSGLETIDIRIDSNGDEGRSFELAGQDKFNYLLEGIRP